MAIPDFRHFNILKTTLPTASENMIFDQQLAENFVPDTRIFRAYLWQKPGITYGYKQQVPQALNGLDSGLRPTGGGIVFHSPGDLVISVVAGLKDPLFPTGLKEKMGWLKEEVQSVFRQEGIVLTPSLLNSAEDFAFCRTYHNPFELQLGTDKILALTLRRFRTCFLIQGILHMQSNFEAFPELSHTFGGYFSNGLSAVLKKSSEDIQDCFCRRFE